MPVSKSKPPRSSSVDRIYEQLRQMAMNYRFRPGEPLNETELATSLGVSRTPLREVLNRLVAEGLLEFVPRRGFSGCPLDARVVHDLYEMRCGLEMISTKLATERATDGELDQLMAFWDDVSQKFAISTAIECVQQDELFHEQLATLSRNAELLRTLRNINARVHYLRLISMEHTHLRDNTCNEHQMILATIRERNAEAAANRMYAHITLRQEELADVLKEGVARLYLRK
jgi:DNA-binding GntR family transcriptional regulator